MRLTRSNRDLALAFQVGYRCGEGKEAQFQFSNCDKAFNNCWPFLKDAAREGGWALSSKDAIEREFRRGWGQAVEKKDPQAVSNANGQTGNEDLQLAHKLGYHCGLGQESQFQFPSVDKAWNEYWPLIKDETRTRNWLSHSRDEVDWAFRRGYGKAINEKALSR